VNYKKDKTSIYSGLNHLGPVGLIHQLGPERVKAWRFCVAYGTVEQVAEKSEIGGFRG
jgi:hypothetical protein